MIYLRFDAFTIRRAKASWIVFEAGKYVADFEFLSQAETFARLAARAALSD